MTRAPGANSSNGRVGEVAGPAPGAHTFFIGPGSQRLVASASACSNGRGPDRAGPMFFLLLAGALERTRKLYVHPHSAQD